MKPNALRRTPYAKMLRLFIIVGCLIMAWPCAKATARSVSPTQAPKTDESLTVPRIVARVKRAVKYGKIESLKLGFKVEEMRADSANPTGFVFMFGTAGEIHRRALAPQPNPFIYDGRDAWLFERLTGAPTPPLDRRLREKLLFPLWIRGGWWLDERAPLAIALLPAESNDKQVALALKFREGIVNAKLFIERATWLPATLIVEYESGPYRVDLKDYREPLGFLYPHEIKINYRGTDSTFRVRAVAEIPATETKAFATPALPNDTSFDNTLPAELKVTRAEGGPGAHCFVRPLVDGREIGWFHFDTGFSHMMIDAKLADELKMPVLDKSEVRGSDGRIRTVTIRRGKTFQLGRVIIKDPIYLAEDLSEKVAPPGEKRAGLVGYPLFARVITEFSDGGNRIALYDPATYRLVKGKWQPFTFVQHAPAVRARLEGNREGLFILDTGASGTVIFNSLFTKEQKLLDGRQVRETQAFGSGGSFKLLLGSIEWFELAGRRFKNPVAEFFTGGEGYEMEGRAGIVGRDFMSPFTVVFDYRERRIAFVK